jgi:hypothetical protein
LLEKSKKNREELEKYSGEVEYEWQALLLQETSITKSIELQLWIDKLESKVEMFLWIISKII